MIFRLRHTTRYVYQSAVTLCHSTIRMLPRQLPWQQCDDSIINISPAPSSTNHFTDAFGNRVIYCSLEEPHTSLEVSIETKVTTLPRSVPQDTGTPWKEALSSPIEQHDRLETEIMKATSPFVRTSDALRDYALISFPTNTTMLEGVLDLNQRIFEEFTYDPGVTTVATPIDEVFRSRHGVCQDFAHLMIACLRSLGFAARYISGYLETLPPPGQPRLVGADASHAWLAVYLPGSGWLELDPTNGSQPGENYIINAWGRDYGDVSPLKGVMSGGGTQHLEVSVDVAPLESTEI